MHFRTHLIGVVWLRTNTVVCRLLMSEFITVCKRRNQNVMFSWVCVILFIGGIHPEEGRFHMEYTLPPPEDRQSMGRHTIDILQECILVPKKLTDVIQAQWCVLSEPYHYLTVEWSGRSGTHGSVALTLTLGTRRLRAWWIFRSLLSEW